MLSGVYRAGLVFELRGRERGAGLECNWVQIRDTFTSLYSITTQREALFPSTTRNTCSGHFTLYNVWLNDFYIAVLLLLLLVWILPSPLGVLYVLFNIYRRGSTEFRVFFRYLYNQRNIRCSVQLVCCDPSLQKPRDHKLTSHRNDLHAGRVIELVLQRFGRKRGCK